MSWNNLKVIGTMLHSLSLSMTVFRVTHQWRRGKFFWDDVWAIVAAFFDTIFFVSLWLWMNKKDRYRSGRPVPIHVGRAIYLLSTFGYTCTVWAARISIASSIQRLLPPGRMKKIVACEIGFFSIIWTIQSSMKIGICSQKKSWILDFCRIGRPFDVLKLSTDIMSNILLVATPLYILWRSKLPKAPRYMIQAVFATSMLTLGVSIVHAVCQTGTNRLLEGSTTHYEAAATVMVCNLLVLVTFFYRIIRNGCDLDDEVTVYLTTEAHSRRPSNSVPLSFTKISTQYQSSESPTRHGASPFLNATSTDVNHATSYGAIDDDRK